MSQALGWKLIAGCVIVDLPRTDKLAIQVDGGVRTFALETINFLTFYIRDKTLCYNFLHPKIPISSSTIHFSSEKLYESKMTWIEFSPQCHPPCRAQPHKSFLEDCDLLLHLLSLVHLLRATLCLRLMAETMALAAAILQVAAFGASVVARSPLRRYSRAGQKVKDLSSDSSLTAWTLISWIRPFTSTNMTFISKTINFSPRRKLAREISKC